MIFSKFLNDGTFEQLWTANPMWIVGTHPASDGFKFVLTITLLPENTTIQAESYFVGDSMKIDISQYLAAYVSFVAPSLPALLTHEFADAQRKLFTVSWEVRDTNNLLVASGSPLTQYRALFGGVSDLFFATSMRYPALTNQPLSREMSRDMVKYQFVYVEAYTGAINAQVTGYRFAGANNVYNVGIPEQSGGANTVTIASLPYLLNALGDLKDYWRVSINFVDSVGAGYSRKHTIDFKETAYRQTKIFIFQNMMGGADTFLATGEVQSEIKVESETYNKALQPSYTKSAGKVGKKTGKPVQMFTAEVGYKTRKELEWLALELLVSENVFVVEKDANNQDFLRAVVVDSESLKFALSSREPQSFELKYTYAL